MSMEWPDDSGRSVQTVTRPRRRRARTMTKLARVIRQQGRKYTWLASMTGYSISSIGAVARGERVGTEKFYRSVSHVLGEDVSP